MDITQHIDDAGCELGNIDRLGFLQRQFGVEARCLGDIGDQPVQTLHFALDLAHQFGALLLGLGVGQDFGRRARGSNRVLQFVGDILGEAVAGLDAPVERGGHVAEGGGHLADLVAAAGKLRQIACGVDVVADALGGSRQTAHRPGDGAPEQHEANSDASSAISDKHEQ